ncbi:WG repeat-containing protein [Pontibacter sp. MBLB2868]|uniref:WG repeat-containing protein n=1 Tax=Pontibacter sp. MBLB2868 TaxID=3451555 RepID=UPI003F75320B
MMKYILGTLLAMLTFLDCYSQDLHPFRETTLWGYRDNQGVVKIEPQFQYASKFMYGIAVVAKNDSLGAIDKNSNLVIPYKYEYLQPLDTSEFLFGFRAKYFGEYFMGVMSSDEKVKIPAEYRHIRKYNNTYIVVIEQDSIIGKGPIGDIRTGKSFYGLMDSKGKFLIPCEYSYLKWVNDSLIVVTQGSAGTNQALFNKRGEQLTGFEYMVFGDFIEGIAKARIGDKFGFIYPSGKVAIPIHFDFCEDFSGGYALIKQQENWGAINKSGKVVVEPKYKYEEVKAELKRKYNR